MYSCCHRAYELVEERHAELVKAMGGRGFEAKVDEFKEASKSVAGKKFIGGGGRGPNYTIPTLPPLS